MEIIFSKLFIVSTIALLFVTGVVYILDKKYITRKCSNCSRTNFIPKSTPFFNCRYCSEDLDKLARANKAATHLS